jgi:hypothetical protein
MVMPKFHLAEIVSKVLCLKHFSCLASSKEAPSVGQMKTCPEVMHKAKFLAP